MAASLLQGQETAPAQMQRRLDKANDLLLDGKRAEAAVQFRQVVQLCRQQGDALLPEEMDALYSLTDLTETPSGKTELLQEMKTRVASSPNPPQPTLLQAYITLVETAVDRQEGRQEEALDKLLSALKAVFGTDSDTGNGRLVRAGLLVNIADILMETGLYKECKDYYQFARQQIEPPSTRMESMYLGTILMGLGCAERQLANAAEAQQYFDQAVTVFQQNKAEQSRHYAYLLLNMGTLQAGQGDKKAGLKTLKKALDMIPEPCNDRAEFLMVYYANALSTGLYADVEAGLQEMKKLAETLQLRPSWWISYYQLQASLDMSTGKLKKAIEATDQAISLVKKEKVVNLGLLAVLYNQMSVNYQLLGEDEMAKAFSDLSQQIVLDTYGAEYADKQAERRKKDKDSAYARTGKLMDQVEQDLAADRLPSALAHLNEILSIYREDGVGGMIYLTVESMKLGLLERMGDTKKLREAADTYLADLREDLKRNLSYMTEEERETYYASVMPSISYAYLTEKDPALAAQVYDAVLLRKNFLLGAGIGLEKLIADSGDTALQSVLMEIKTLRSGPAMDMQLSKEERYAATQRADSLENVLIRRSHDYGNFLALSGIGWKDVQAALGPQEVAVEFIQAGPPHIPVYCALLLRKGWKKPVNVVLCKDDDQLMLSLADPQYNEVVYGNAELYNLFWKPLEAYLKPDETVYFAMDGFLNAFAFEHFMTDGGDRMMDRYQLHRVSSTREVIGRAPAPPAHSAALFGGFDYNLSSEEVSYYAAATRSDDTGEDWGYLPGSLVEVEAADQILKDKLDVSLYTGEEGLESRFKALSGAAPNLLHVATHGYYFEGDNDPMERSGLVFSGANSLREDGPSESGEDGLLKASEIALLDLRSTELIVLSACQSGVGSISSDGVYGLQRAFKKAGVHSILMSLWKVNDQVTAQMMQLFYTGLSSGKDSREAFQAAREALRTTYTDPLLWAPFVLLEN